MQAQRPPEVIVPKPAVVTKPAYQFNPQRAISFLSRLNLAEKRDDTKHDYAGASMASVDILDSTFQQKANELFRRSLPAYAVASYKPTARVGPAPEAAPEAPRRLRRPSVPRGNFSRRRTSRWRSKPRSSA